VRGTPDRDAAQVAVRVVQGIGGHNPGLGRGQLPPSCRRVRSLDVDDGDANAADSDDDAFASSGRDRLSVDQVRGDVDEVTLPDRDQLSAPGPNSTVVAPLVM
jgi:hypothetical protein